LCYRKWSIAEGKSRKHACSAATEADKLVMARHTHNNTKKKSKKA